MRLILIHGINQQASNSEQLKTAWLGHLRGTLGLGEAWSLDRLTKVELPFYGKALFDLTENRADVAAVAMGAGDEDPGADEFAAFAKAALVGMAVRMGASQAEIEADAAGQVEALGAGIHKRLFKAAARAIEAISPLHGNLALRLLGQAHAYLKRPHIAQAVDDLVRPALEDDEPAIIVAHSLGTIVSFKLLREFADKGRPRSCALYVTLGSPLGIQVVRGSFPPPRARPRGVARWLNGADKEDFVALHQELTRDNFGLGIENLSDIDNGYDDPHAIAGYLAHKPVAEAITAAIATESNTSAR